VDRADARRLELGEREIQTRARVRARVCGGASALDLGAQAELHLARRLLGERDRHDAAERRRSGGEQGEDAGDELGRLAGAGGGFDDERAREIGSNATPRVVVDFQLTDSAMVYLSAAKGFKGGTTSGRDTAALRNLLRIVGDPETNWSYEGGLKADWLDRRLRTNLAVFRNKYDGLQFGVTTPDGGFGRINAGNATIDGLELEVTAVPVKGLELNGSLGLLDSEYTKWTAALSTCAAQGITTVDQYLKLPLKQAPEWSYRLGANYSYDMGQRGVLSLGADYSAKDDHYNNLCASPGIRVHDYEFLNAQLRWENASGKLLVTLAGTNLTDSEVFNGGFDFGRSLGFGAGYLYPPRMWSLAVRYGL